MFFSFLFSSTGLSQSSKPNLFIISSQLDLLSEKEVGILETRFDLKLTASENKYPQFKLISSRNDSIFASIVTENYSNEEIFLEEDSFFLFSTKYWIAIGTVASLLILYYTRF